MTGIMVDSAKCRKDSLCVVECPMKIISMNKVHGIPEIVPHAESICIGCGHCVAVCPHGALSLGSMHADECKEIPHDWNPGIDVIDSYFASRRSIRRYKKDPLEKEKLQRLLSIAAHAPTGHNSRTVEYIVYTDNEEIKKLTQLVIDWMKEMMNSSPDMAKGMHFDMITQAWEAGVDVVTYNAPVIIAAHSKKSSPHSAISCTIALSHIELIAPSMGIGCCWAGFFTWCAMSYAPLKEALQMPAGNAVYGTMLAGYPHGKYYRIPKRESVIQWR